MYREATLNLMELRSDLDSLCRDMDKPSSKTTWNEYNPQSSSTDFYFKLGMGFSSMDHLRNFLREEFIKGDQEFVYIFNDQTRLREKC